MERSSSNGSRAPLPPAAGARPHQSVAGPHPSKQCESRRPAARPVLRRACCPARAMGDQSERRAHLLRNNRGGHRVCEQVTVELPPSPASVGVARHHVSYLCEEWGLGDVCDDVVLPLSELVTNATMHARTTTRITVSLAGGLIEVAVNDGDPRPAVPRPARSDLLADIDAVATRLKHLPDDPHDPDLHVGEAGAITAGRGLAIVNAVADEWGSSALAAGKVVWFRLRTPETHARRASCTCSTAIPPPP